MVSPLVREGEKKVWSSSVRVKRRETDFGSETTLLSNIRDSRTQVSWVGLGFISTEFDEVVDFL